MSYKSFSAALAAIVLAPALAVAAPAVSRPASKPAIVKTVKAEKVALKHHTMLKKTKTLHKSAKPKAATKI
jgi:hypothetical protein